MTDIDHQYPILYEKARKAGQEHIFRFWDTLDRKGKEKLLAQASTIDFHKVNTLYETLVRNGGGKDGSFRLEPPQVVPIPDTPQQKRTAAEAGKAGEELIRRGGAAAFLVAGGQGTRLGFDGPKGCYPIGPVTSKSLFQLHAEKIRAASRRYGAEIPWYIMTSEANHPQTVDFFREHGYFGLPEASVMFFRQNMIPGVDEDGRMLLEAPDTIFMSPNGHGGSLEALYQSGALDDMEERGIETISYFQVDNVLITIIDPVFIGLHMRAGAEMSSKMVEKKTPEEKVGVFGVRDGRLSVIEYSDLSREDMYRRDEAGRLLYRAGSIAIHMIQPDFVRSLAEDGLKLPYHSAHKKVPYFDESGSRIEPDAPNGYKFETFVFDALKKTENSVVMEVEREREFSPVKNREGDDSPETARRDLCNYWGSWLETAGVEVRRDTDGNVEGRLEISPLFAGTEEEFLRRCPEGLDYQQNLYIGPSREDDA